MTGPDNEDFLNQCDALLTCCGYVSLEDWSIVALTGADRQSFLHNMCTNEIQKLSAGEGCEAFLTDVKGKIVAHVWVLLQEDALTLLAVANQGDTIINHLDRYIIREDVQLADRSQAETWMVLAGEQADAVLNNSGAELTTPWQNAPYRIGGVNCRLVRFPLPGRNAFLLGTAVEQVAAIRKQLVDAGAIPCGQQARDTMRTESSWPLFGVDFDSSNLPQEVARDSQAISFTKGCYLGQETIARIDALGHVNKQLVRLKFAEGVEPAAGTAITTQGQPVGVATTIGRSPRSGDTLALGMVRRGSNDVGAMLDSEDGPVEVIATPALDQ